MDIIMEERSMLFNAKIGVLVPTDGDFDLTSSPKERTSIFLDEQIDVYVVLRTAADESILQEQLPRLSISLETYVTGIQKQASLAQSPETDSQPQARDVLDVYKIAATQDPLSVVSSDGVTLAWRIGVHIGKTMRAEYRSLN